MNEPWKAQLLESTAATDVVRGESIQSLWSGYGEIFRAHLAPQTLGSVVVKHISPGGSGDHPRGWDSDRSNQRKLRSYQVEAQWYENWASRIDANSGCRIPKFLGSTTHESERWIVMEDLDASGFAGRRHGLSADTARVCLRWLANFHAAFLGADPHGLWPVGTYWHLETRPDELNVMKPGPLKDFAEPIDSLLSSCRFKTIVHGDAKVANFCFSANNDQVAAVDFQYVGGGCGMKDVAYFFGSCFDENECEAFVPSLLEDYFADLREAIDQSALDENIDCDALEEEWRDLFAPAWTDFHRFLLGWMPTHQKINRYTEKLTAETLDRLAKR